MIRVDNNLETTTEKPEELRPNNMSEVSVPSAVVDTIPQRVRDDSTHSTGDNVSAEGPNIIPECGAEAGVYDSVDAVATKQNDGAEEGLANKPSCLVETKHQLVVTTGTTEVPRTISSVRTKCEMEEQVRNATSELPRTPTASCRPFSSPTSPEYPSVRLTGSGTKFKLIHEGDMKLCRLNHTRTVISKVMNSKYLRRWECHRLKLGESEIFSTTVRSEEEGGAVGGRKNICSDKSSAFLYLFKIHRVDISNESTFQICIKNTKNLYLK